MSNMLFVQKIGVLYGIICGGINFDIFYFIKSIYVDTIKNCFDCRLMQDDYFDPRKERLIV